MTDSSLTGVNKDGFGGLKVGWQGNGDPGYAMSTGTSAKGWTGMNRPDVCFFFISLADIEDYTASTEGDDVRLFIGHWGWADLGATGEAGLVNITGSLPEGIVKIQKADDSVIGFVIKEADLEAALED
jgi:hypothetical protein